MLIYNKHNSYQPADFAGRHRENDMESRMFNFSFLVGVAHFPARRPIGASRLSIESLMFGEKYFGKHVAGLQVRKEVVLP